MFHVTSFLSVVFSSMPLWSIEEWRGRIGTSWAALGRTFPSCQSSHKEWRHRPSSGGGGEGWPMVVSTVPVTIFMLMYITVSVPIAQLAVDDRDSPICCGVSNYQDNKSCRSWKSTSHNLTVIWKKLFSWSSVKNLADSLLPRDLSMSMKNIWSGVSTFGVLALSLLVALNLQSTTFQASLLSQCGDIEPNPGPLGREDLEKVDISHVLCATGLVNQLQGQLLFQESQQSLTSPHSTPLTPPQASGYKMTGKRMTSELTEKVKVLVLGSDSEQSAANLNQSVGEVCLTRVELQTKAPGGSEEASSIGPDLRSEHRIRLEDLGSELNDQASQNILVEGVLGTGKTTLVPLLIDRYCLKRYLTILYIHLSCQICERIKKLTDVAEELSLPVSQLKSQIEDKGNDSLIIIDGITELTQQKDWKSRVFAKIIFGEEFPNATRVLLTRPSGVAHLLKDVKLDHFYRLEGLLDPDSILLSKPEENCVSKLCQEHPKLRALCKIPLMVKLLIKKQNSNWTITDICLHLVTEIIKRRLGQLSIQFDDTLTLFSLPESIFDDFLKLCKFAFHSLASSSILDSPEQKELFLSGFSLSNAYFLFSNEGFGLIEAVYTDGTFLFQFIDPMIQHFLAGYYIQSLPPVDLLDVLYRYSEMLIQSDPLCEPFWLKFFFGLTWRRSVVMDPIKYMATTLIEFLVHRVLKGQDNAIFTLMLCIAETKDDQLWKKLSSNLGSSIFLRLTVDDFRQHMWTIASMLSCSGIRDWKTSARDFTACKELENFEVYSSAQISKTVVHDVGDVVTISPKMTIEAAFGRNKELEQLSRSSDNELAIISLFQCRAIREILQRVFKIFTVVKLKGDASNPAYVSFLSCECFKNSLQDNLEFDPCIPYHFLEVTSQKTLKRIQDENKIHMATHSGKAIELVILLKPCIRRVTIKLPVTSETHCIVLTSEELAHTISEGAISGSLSTTESTQEILDVVFTETLPGSHSEMVRPALPLPPNFENNSKASTVMPKVVTPRVAPQNVIGGGELEQRETRQRQQYLGEGDENESPTFDQAFSSRYNQNLPAAFEQQQMVTATAQVPSQQVLHPKLSIRPGAILYTSVPDQFPPDLIHPLPDESHQVRRGGNGQIFKGMIGGVNVVFKKTNYRSKEFAIITKVKHKNIVKLLAFMYGAENPTHRRRHFCYHIMPQLSGDCARMLTDKKELTMKELHKKHSDNPRKIGVIRGNIKYLLKEVLHGLRYLHSLYIAHRDIKGSNILLKFFCPCTNPLECGCDTKYHVQICDFDAAVELDKSERIPTTPSHSSHSPYVCVPVGTNGFRSPECSMLAVSNSSDAFSPPINTRCDIWSVGILTTRMLIGATGPSTQRQMALLLLFYHRQRYMPEGLHKGDCLVVDRIVTDKLLNIPELIKEVGWLKGAVRFVECCVAVDPLTRHSAEALLQHDFLY